MIKKRNAAYEKKKINMLEKIKPGQRTQMISSCLYLVLTYKNITEKIAMW